VEFRKRGLILALSIVLVSCGKNDPFLAKSSSISKTHLADIEARICRYDGNDCFLPIMALNIEGGTQVAAVDVLPGEAKYAACGACHGSNGGGGVGPALAGQTVQYIVGRLNQYKNGEKVGSQSNMMWGQAAGLSETDINDLAEYIVTL
jgi:cytochrome c553